MCAGRADVPIQGDRIESDFDEGDASSWTRAALRIFYCITMGLPYA
jgi:hypothetical protein